MKRKARIHSSFLRKLILNCNFFFLDNLFQTVIKHVENGKVGGVAC